jgi:glycosyltransferase involved in cell wall biosynthesis
LEETILSVLNQKYTHWEIILVDDGSVDESTGIAQDYASRFPDKIFYVEHKDHVNKAAAATRNLGLQKSKGELVALLDADDVWMTDKLENQVEIFNRFPEVKMVCEASLYWFSWNNDRGRDEVIQVGVIPDRIYKPPKLAVELYPLSRGQAPCPSGIMVKSSALKLHNGFEESFTGEYQVYEDQAFLSKMYLNECVYISSACNNYYRQRSNSVMDATKALGHYDIARRFYLHWLKKYLRDRKIKNRELEFLLWKASLHYTNPFFYKVVNKIYSRLLVRKTKREF